MKAGTLVPCAALVTLLASACELQYTCDTVEAGGAGAGYPTGSAGAGDYLREGDEDEGEEVGSESFELMAGCTPVHSCTESYEKCQDIWWALYAQERPGHYLLRDLS